IEGHSLRDGEQITRADFYRRLPTLSQVPTTAAPPGHEFALVFRRLLEEADTIIAVLVSASLSGMMNSAYIGKNELPGADIHLVDSRQVTMGLGWQAIVAAEAAAAGQSAVDILALLEDVRPRVRVVALLDTLDYLHRSGRVAWARVVAARLLRIKPLIEVAEGVVSMAGRVRTRGKAIEQVLRDTQALGRLERLASLHTAAPPDLAAFRSRLEALFPDETIVSSEVGPVVGTHVGPWCLGIAAIVAA
ncbi:MAG: DegV family protein, partial [Anaerolineae bacterium]|nr:DegV family protein [Anaerolineae bacterium]